jgi:hypothetical protein
MVFADEAHCAGLRAFLSHLLDEPDFGTHRQTVEGVIENTVAVKENLAAISGFDEPVILSGKEFRHTAVIFLFMWFDLTAHFPNGILNLTLRRAECILDRDRNVLMLWRVAVSFGHDDVLMRRHGDADIDLEQIALLMPRLRRNDRHIAARDPVMEFLQVFGLPFDLGAYFLRRLRMLERDIERHLHWMFLYLRKRCIQLCFCAGVKSSRLACPDLWGGCPVMGIPTVIPDPKMTAILSYIASERRGVKLAPGKHSSGERQLLFMSS